MYGPTWGQKTITGGAMNRHTQLSVFGGTWGTSFFQDGTQIGTTAADIARTIASTIGIFSSPGGGNYSSGTAQEFAFYYTDQTANRPTIEQNQRGYWTAPQMTVDVDADLYVSGAIYDSSDDEGNNNQILTATGSGTNWVDPSAISFPATSIDTTGATTNQVLTIDGSTPAKAVWQNAQGDDLGNHVATKPLDMATHHIVANGGTGSTGQVLTRTGTGMTWTSPTTTTAIQTLTATGSINDGVGVVLLTPAAAMTVTMPQAGSAAYPVGTVLHIRRTNAHTTTTGITLSSGTGTPANRQIESRNSRLMNIGFQSNSFVATASGWLVIN